MTRRSFLSNSIGAFLGKHVVKISSGGLATVATGLAVLNSQVTDAKDDIKKLDEKTGARVTRAEFEKLNKERVLDHENRLRELEAYKNATSSLVLDLKSDVMFLKQRGH